jgi:hypothetical protein
MGDRLKVFALVAVLGFMAGVIAQLFADYAIPWLGSVLPAIIQVRFVAAGFAGACLTLAMISVWAWFSGKRQTRM